MTFQDYIDNLAEDLLDSMGEIALEIAVERAPRDLGPLSEAIVLLPVIQKGSTYTGGIEYGEPDVIRPRGYYPGVLEDSAVYGHQGFVEETARAIADALS